jgi:guanylate kinase
LSSSLKCFPKPDKGVLFVITGSSGTGKTTLLKQAFKVLPRVQFSVSATTRSIRKGEKNGVDYHFVNPTEFERLLEDNALLEWAEVYGNCYGTLREPVETALRGGQSILLEIDVQGARQIREKLPEAVLVFVLPPSLEAIEKRLRGRSTDSEEIISRRVAEAMVQISACGEFDYLVVNDDLEEAHKVFQSVLISELCRTERRASLVADMAHTDPTDA